MNKPEVPIGLILLVVLVTAASSGAQSEYVNWDDLMLRDRVELDGYYYFDLVDIAVPLDWQMDWDPVLNRVEMITREGIRIQMLIGFDFIDVGGIPLRVPLPIRQHAGRLLISDNSLRTLRQLLPSPPMVSPTPRVITPTVQRFEDPVIAPSDSVPATTAELVANTPTPSVVIDDPPDIIPDPPVIVAGTPQAETPTLVVTPADPPEASTDVIEVELQDDFLQPDAPVVAFDLVIPPSDNDQPPALGVPLEVVTSTARQTLAASHGIRLWMTDLMLTQGHKLSLALEQGTSVWCALSAGMYSGSQLSCSLLIHPGPVPDGRADQESLLFEQVNQPFVRDSEILAETILAELRQVLPAMRSAGVKKVRIANLEGIRMPAVWVELNIPDSAELMAPEQQATLRDVGVAIAEAIAEFVRNYHDE